MNVRTVKIKGEIYVLLKDVKREFEKIGITTELVLE